MKTKPPFDGEIHAVSAKTMPDFNSPKREPGWFLGDPTPTRDEAVLSVDALAQEIRRVDGSHSLGAGALAEALMPFLLASAPAPASGGVDAVAELTRQLWEAKYALAKAREAAKELNRWSLVIESAMHHDAPRDHPKVMAAIRQLREAASLSPAATPVSEGGGEDDEQRRDAWSDFTQEHLEDGKGHAPAQVYAACWEAFDRAWPVSPEAAHVAALAVRCYALAKPAGGDVREALDWLAGFNAYRAGPCAQDVRTAFISGWMHRAEQEAALSPSTSAGRVGG